MVLEVNTSGLADYLARARGQNITPSFSNQPGSTGNAEFFLQDQDFSAVGFNPFQEGEETQLEKEEREAEEKRKAEWEARRSIETFTDPEDIRLYASQRSADLNAQVEAERDGYRREYGLPAMYQTRDILVQAAGGDSQAVEAYQSSINIKEALVNDRLAIVDGKLTGRESAKYAPIQDYLTELGIRETTIVADDTSKRAQELALDKTKDRARVGVILEKGITQRHLDTVSTLTGTSPPTNTINTYTPQTLRTIDKIGVSTLNGTIAYSASDLASIDDKQSRLLVFAQVDKQLNAAEAELFKNRTLEWEKGAALVVKGQEKEIRDKIARDPLLDKAGKKAETLSQIRQTRNAYIQQQNQVFKQQNTQFKMFSPKLAQFASEDQDIATKVYDTLNSLVISDSTSLYEYSTSQLRELTGRTQMLLQEQYPGYRSTIETHRLSIANRLNPPSVENFDPKLSRRITAIYTQVIEDGFREFNHSFKRSMGLEYNALDPLLKAMRPRQSISQFDVGAR